MDRATTVARFTQVMRRWVCAAGVLSSSGISGTKVYRTYVGRLERGESGVTVEALAAILAALGVSLGEFFSSFTKVVRPRTPRRRG